MARHPAASAGPSDDIQAMVSTHVRTFATGTASSASPMGMKNDRTKVLQGIKDAGVPMLVSMSGGSAFPRSSR
jgi:hypothetical protein